MTPLPLYGRDRELRLLHELVDGAGERGGALVVRGEAGIGKSALLAAAGRRARGRGMLVLSTSGVQSEAHLPFAGLHQLLRPILAGVDSLPAPQRAAVQAAFGIADTAAPDLFLIALAALDLLADSAAHAPVLLIVEDAHWLDRPTCDVLAFVARRLESEPIVLLAASRDGFESVLVEAGLPELRLEGLDAVDAAALLDAVAADPDPLVRRRLLEEAAGNPLALVELPAALAAEHISAGAPLPVWLPLTTRLERAFATRVSELPAATRALLLVAAIDDGRVLAEVLSAAAIVHGGNPAMDALEPAIAAGLVEVDEIELRFRHPLMRSAIHQAASIPQRRAAHAALAGVLAGQPDRSAWHRAAATIGASEEVAAELEAAATRAHRRGGVEVAVAALERAAQLSEDPARKGSRLLRAAELAFELGRHEMAVRLVREAEPLALTALDQGRMTWIREVVDPSGARDPVRVTALVETAERMQAAGDTNLALGLLLAAALRFAWADAGAEARTLIVAAAERTGVPDDDPRLLVIHTYAATVEQAAGMVDRLARWAPSMDSDPDAMRLLGMAASATGASDLAAGFYAAAIEGLRAQGRLGLLAQALAARAWAEAQLGRLDVAIAAAEEGGRLARETAQPLWLARAQVAHAMLAGLRGDEETAEMLAAEAERIIHPSNTTVQSIVRLTRGVTALSCDRYADAYTLLRPMFDPAHPTHGYVGRSTTIQYLAEAAVRSGHRDEARALLEELEPLTAQTPSLLFQIGMRHARPLLADDGDAEALFLAALSADLATWPFQLARLQLAYGAWLRRQRRVADSRAPLRAAREAFDALGVIPWGERARQELRAAGEASRRRTPDVLDLLTPQELQIAQLAADGLSNREVGQRLYLSHRTVSTHLYRIYPKLGITSRAELRVALETGVSATA